MGATDFTEYVETNMGVQDAYHHAVSDALSEYGHDAYNGTISTTCGAVAVNVSPMTLKAADLYAERKTNGRYEDSDQDNVPMKWEHCYALPVASDDKFRLSTEKFTVELDTTGDDAAHITEWTLREAAVKKATKAHGNAVHAVEVVPIIKYGYNVKEMSGKPVTKWAVDRPYGRGMDLFDTKAKAMKAIKERLGASPHAGATASVRAVKVYADAEGNSTPDAVTVTRTVVAATAKVTVTLATAKRSDTSRDGWLFYGVAAC
jgi:hypothetical protein